MSVNFTSIFFFFLSFFLFLANVYLNVFHTEKALWPFQKNI